MVAVRHRSLFGLLPEPWDSGVVTPAAREQRRIQPLAHRCYVGWALGRLCWEPEHPAAIGPRIKRFRVFDARVLETDDPTGMKSND